MGIRFATQSTAADRAVPEILSALEPACLHGSKKGSFSRPRANGDGSRFPAWWSARDAAMARAVVSAASRKSRPVTGSTLGVRADKAVLAGPAGTTVLAAADVAAAYMLLLIRAGGRLAPYHAPVLPS